MQNAQAAEPQSATLQWSQGDWHLQLGYVQKLAEFGRAVAAVVRLSNENLVDSWSTPDALPADALRNSMIRGTSSSILRQENGS